MKILKKKSETELNVLTSDLTYTIDSEDRDVHSEVNSVEVDLEREPLIFFDN